MWQNVKMFNGYGYFWLFSNYIQTYLNACLVFCTVFCNLEQQITENFNYFKEFPIWDCFALLIHQLYNSFAGQYVYIIVHLSDTKDI